MSRKEEILDAVVEIFKTKGIQSDFTISELARRVDIGKSTIYEYFTTKDEILSEAFVRIFSNAIDQIANREADNDMSFEEHLKDELRFVFHLATESSFIFHFLTTEFKDTVPKTMKGTFAKRMKETMRHYETVYAAIMKKGMDEGLLQPDNLPYKSMLFASLLSGSVTRLTNVNVEQTNILDLDTYIDYMYDTVLKIFN